MPKEKLELQEFTFYVVGDGRKVFCGKFEAIDLDHTLKQARKNCKTLSLPGWQLVCSETEDTFPAVEFIDHQDHDNKVYR